MRVAIHSLAACHFCLSLSSFCALCVCVRAQAHEEYHSRLALYVNVCHPAVRLCPCLASAFIHVLIYLEVELTQHHNIVNKLGLRHSRHRKELETSIICSCDEVALDRIVTLLPRWRERRSSNSLPSVSSPKGPRLPGQAIDPARTCSFRQSPATWLQVLRRKSEELLDRGCEVQAACEGVQNDSLGVRSPTPRR